LVPHNWPSALTMGSKQVVRAATVLVTVALTNGFFADRVAASDEWADAGADDSNAQPKARPDETDIFALIVGVNESTEPSLEPLRYADDDAIRYQELFTRMGGRTYVLTRPDENTRRLHPQGALRTAPPSREQFIETASRLSRDVQMAHEAGRKTVVYFVYAGHGNRDEDDGRGYLTLSDARLYAPDLQKALLTEQPAQTLHFIIDACHAGFLAEARGPGGSRRALRGFATELITKSRDPRVGLLFATSPTLKTFEYEGFQAGVFSHLVRSGLYGAADFNVDGHVDYREMQQFVAQATAPIVNEKYRPQLRALRPTATRQLLDIRSGLESGPIVFEHDTPSAHYVLEDARGVRLIDLHNAPHSTTHLVRPAARGSLTIARADGAGDEYEIPLQDEPILFADLTPRSRTIAARGAADNAFRQLFAVPFAPSALETLAITDRDYLSVLRDAERWRLEETRNQRQKWGRVSFVSAGVAAAVGVASGFQALSLANEDSSGLTQLQAQARNDSLARWETTALISGGVAGAAALFGLALHLWPDAEPDLPSDTIAQEDAFGLAPDQDVSANTARKSVRLHLSVFGLSGSF